MAHHDRAGASGQRLRLRRFPAAALAGLTLLCSLAACNTGDVFALQPAVDIGSQTAALPRAEPASAPVMAAAPMTGMQSLVPSNPYMASYPRMVEPAPQGDVLPDDEVACRRELRKLGVTFRDLSPIDDGGACRIDHPVQMSAIGSIKLKPAATVTCAMARSFANWAKYELQPSARLRYLSGVDTIHQGSSYSCRNIRGSRTASEHSKGNAIDVMRIELNNDKDIKVRKPGLFSFREKGLLNNVRKDACAYFSTVLGPGYDRDHKDHFHFDIKKRRNNYVACR